MAVALLLHRDGHQVRLFDQFDTPRPLGSGLMLQPTGLAVLSALGLADEIRRLGKAIERIHGRAMPDHRVVVDVLYDRQGQGHAGLAVHRAALFGVLHRAVERSGIDVNASTRIVVAESGSGADTSLIDAAGRRHGPFDLVVDALGQRSPLSDAQRREAGQKPLAFGALWTSLPWIDGLFRPDWLEQRYRRSDVMVGVLPVGRIAEDSAEQTAFFWSLKPETHDTWRAAGLNAWKAEVRAIWPETDALLAGIDDPDQLVLARYSHMTLPRPARAAMAQIGDAAHATSPQLGQGANMALLDAYALALALREQAELSAALDVYMRLRRWHVRSYQAISAVFTPLYQSDSRVLPWLRDNVMWPLSRIPPAPRILSAMVCGWLVDPLTPLGLAMASPDRRATD
jgi:salicylate hydroxylase